MVAQPHPQCRCGEGSGLEAASAVRNDCANAQANNDAPGNIALDGTDTGSSATPFFIWASGLKTPIETVWIGCRSPMGAHLFV